MAYRLEVKTRAGWVVLDEHRDQVGRRALSRAAYEAYARRAFPTILRREYRVTQYAAPRFRASSPLLLLPREATRHE